jgi:hypothetical protein
MMRLLAGIICIAIVIFFTVYLVAWFATRNRPIKLGGKRKS